MNSIRSWPPTACILHVIGPRSLFVSAHGIGKRGLLLKHGWTQGHACVVDPCTLAYRCLRLVQRVRVIENPYFNHPDFPMDIWTLSCSIIFHVFHLSRFLHIDALISLTKHQTPVVILGLRRLAANDNPVPLPKSSPGRPNHKTTLNDETKQTTNDLLGMWLPQSQPNKAMEYDGFHVYVCLCVHHPSDLIELSATFHPSDSTKAFLQAVVGFQAHGRHLRGLSFPLVWRMWVERRKKPDLRELWGA